MTKQTNWKKSGVSTSKGFGDAPKSGLKKAAEQHGRVILAVKPESKVDPRPLDFAYTIPQPGITEPVLLASYPSEKTLGFLMNSLGDHFRENGWSDLNEEDFTYLKGFLGESGEIPVGARLLSLEERARSAKRLTCQANPETPVVLLSIPDPSGSTPMSPFCQPEVARADLFLYSRIVEDGLDPGALWDQMQEMLEDRKRDALIEAAETVETLAEFTYWWENLSAIDEKAAVVLMNGSGTLSDLYAEYATENGLNDDEEEEDEQN